MTMRMILRKFQFPSVRLLNLLAFYREEYGVDRYKDLYSIAHELSRESEKGREARNEDGRQFKSRF